LHFSVLYFYFCCFLVCSRQYALAFGRPRALQLLPEQPRTAPRAPEIAVSGQTLVVFCVFGILCFGFPLFCFLFLFLLLFGLFSPICPCIWPAKGSQAAPGTAPDCPKSSRNRSFRPNLSGRLRFWYFWFWIFICWFSIVIFTVFWFVLANLPLHLAGQGLSSCSRDSPGLPQELPKSQFQAKP
jgi:hypothetical protein